MEEDAEPSPAAPPSADGGVDDVGEAAASAPAPSTPSARQPKQKKSKQNRKSHRHGKQKQKGGVKETNAVEAKEGRRPRKAVQRGFRRPAPGGAGVGRKRALSFPAASKFFLPYKRPRQDAIIPPTKFLLGGNISDPLNLNSLRDEDVNRTANAVTPRSSPLPTPPRHKNKIDVIIPPNIRDPLNLMTPLDNDEYEKQIEAAPSARPPPRKKRRRNASCSLPLPLSVRDEPAEVVPEEEPAPCGGDVPRPSPPPAAPASPGPPAQPGDPAPPQSATPAPPPTPHPRPRKRLASDAADKIVSPVVPQPGAWMRVHPHTHAAKRAPPPRPPPPQPASSLPKFRAADARYQYGNYDRYYGYRNLNAMMDVRLKVFEKNRHLFQYKDVLDIGCNVGHVSIIVARDLGAKSVMGIDIDGKLIARARKNVSNFVIVPPSKDSPPKENKPSDLCLSNSSYAHRLDRNISVESAADDTESINTSADIGEMKNDSSINLGKFEPNEKPSSSSDKQFPNRSLRRVKRNRRSHHRPPRDSTKFFFPVSCPILYGPTEVIGCPIDGKSDVFPQNISFKQANYVLKDENLINAEPPQYDLILCLSVTKWIHLNWGDSGLKMAFKRMFAQLRPGGKLILEAQAWSSYKKKKKLTESIYRNFSSIEFHPNKFKEYLLSPEVGFSQCCVLGVPQHLSKGFRRPIFLYIKGDFTPSKVQWSDTYAPSHHQPDLNIEEQPKKVYAYVLPSYHPSSSRMSENNTPSYGAATPCAFQENNSTEESPFYNPRSDSYMPSYSSSDRPKTVYASLSSPQSDYGGTPSHVSESGGSVPPHSGVYATMASPASPFLEPSPGNSTTPSHPFTPSHSASYDANFANKKVYASLHSPHEDGTTNGKGQPIYSPSVAGASRQGGYSPLYTGSALCPLPEVLDVDNTNSNDSTQVKSLSEHATPATSPSSDLLTNTNDVDHHSSPKELYDVEQ